MKNIIMGRGRVVGIATRYGLDDPGIESRRGGGGAGFSEPFQTGLGPTRYRARRGGKGAGAGPAESFRTCSDRPGPTQVPRTSRG
jgi:hypothetical protein